MHCIRILLSLLISISFHNIEIKESNIVSEKPTIQNIEQYQNYVIVRKYCICYMDSLFFLIVLFVQKFFCKKAILLIYRFYLIFIPEKCLI